MASTLPDCATKTPRRCPHLREVHICHFGAFKRRSNDVLASRVARIGTAANVREDVLEWEVGHVVFPCVGIELEDVRQGDAFGKEDQQMFWGTTVESITKELSRANLDREGTAASFDSTISPSSTAEERSRQRTSTPAIQVCR